MGAQRPTVTPGHQSPTWLPRVQRGFFFFGSCCQTETKTLFTQLADSSKGYRYHRRVFFYHSPVLFFSPPFLLEVQGCSCPCHSWYVNKVNVCVSEHFLGLVFVRRPCLFVRSLSSSSGSTNHKITRRVHISLFSLLCKLLLFFFFFYPPLSTSAHLVRHND